MAAVVVISSLKILHLAPLRKTRLLVIKRLLRFIWLCEEGNEDLHLLLALLHIPKVRAIASRLCSRV